MPALKNWHRLGLANDALTDWSSLDERAVDPYLIWADITGFLGATLGKPPVDRAKASVQVALELELAPAETDAWPDLGVPYARAFGHEQVAYATAEVAPQAIRGLIDHRRVRRLELGFVNENGVKPIMAGEGPRPVEGPVVAVIDFGCAFAHERFRHLVEDKWKTRIAYLWDQGDDSDERDPAAPWRPVWGQRRGRELTATAIDDLLAKHRTGSRIDEDAVYRAARYPDVTARLTHGTHVLDLAAGADPMSAIEREPKIIFVQLPTQAVEDTSGGSMVTCVIDALRYILDRTKSINPNAPATAPLVINLSYGSMAGPHDGSTLLESAMDALLAESKQLNPDGNRRRYIEIVLPAGNNFEADGHAMLKLTRSRRSRSLSWQIQPDDSTDTFLELWYDRSAAGRVHVQVTPPEGQTCDVPIDTAWALQAADATAPVAAVIHRTKVASGLNDAMVLIALAPTRARNPLTPLADAGIWTVSARLVDDGDPVEVFAWIERDDPAIGSRGSPRQSIFVRDRAKPARNQDYDKSSLVRRSVTCNSIANGANTIVVGGCVGHGAEFDLARYSSAGPPRRLARAKREWPDLVAVSEESPALFGVAAAGTRSGIRVRMNGTSVAAPQVCRALIRTFFTQANPLQPDPLDPERPPKEKPGPAWKKEPSGSLSLEPPPRSAGQRHRVGRGRLIR